MSGRILREQLLALLEGDDALFELMCEAELLPRDEQLYAPEHVEKARVVCTLVHSLEVNWPGVEVIVRLREELGATRRQVAALIALIEQNNRT